MDNATILYIIAGIVGLIGLAFAFSRHSTINGRSKWIFALPLIAGASFLVLWQMGTLATWGLGLSPLASGIPGEDGIILTPPPSSQYLREDTTVTLSGKDLFTGAPAGGNHRYSINGNPALTVADAGTFTASPGDVLDILYGNASTTGEFSVVAREVVPDKGTVTFSTLMVDNGTITTTFRNDVGDRITATGVNQTIGANDLRTVDAKLTVTSETAFQHGLAIIVDYNDTAFDNVKLHQGGAEFQITTVPNTYTALWGVNGGTKGYVIPGIFKGGTDLVFKVDLDSGAMNPTITNLANVTLAYFPMNYYINDDQGGAFAGPSHLDEDNVLTRPGAGTGQLYYD